MLVFSRRPSHSFLIKRAANIMNHLLLRDSHVLGTLLYATYPIDITIKVIYIRIIQRKTIKYTFSFSTAWRYRLPWYSRF